MARTKKQKQDLPYGCDVSKCNQYFKTQKQLLEHYKMVHPDIGIVLHDDGTFTRDSRKVPKPEKSKKSTPKKDKPATTEKAKSDEPKKTRGDKGGFDGFGSMDEIDLSKITLWKDVTDKKKTTILEFARGHLEAKTSTINGLKALILKKYSIKVWGKQIGKALEAIA